jgi:hypothetical protein
MSNSVQTVVSDGSLTLLDISFSYFDRAHVHVYFDNVEQTLGTTWSWVGATDKKIQFSPAVADNIVVKVQRVTPLETPRHVYSSPGNAPFNKSTVDDNFRQTLYAAQEAQEGASLAQLQQDLDAQGNKITDLGDALLDGDAVNLKVLREYLPYGPAATSLHSRITAEEDHTVALAGQYGSALVGAATYAQLRAYTGDATRIQIGGRSNYFDGAGGIFVRTGIAADNDGTVLVDALGRSWVRQFTGATQAIWFGVVADWNESTGTDVTARIQAAINSFGVNRGVLDLPAGAIRADSARIDFKRVTIHGVALTQSGAQMGTELYVGSIGGLYTTIEDNQGPRHENLRITSSVTMTANGQTLLDLTGINYPRLDNIVLYGGQKGLKLSGGVSVESHYGTFTNVSASRCYTGISVEGGSRTQTHSFFGGRMWDCVEGYANEGTGTSDINFYGTAFESDQAIRHAPTARAAQTKLFSCRNESNVAPEIPAGQFTEVGTYWSGNRRAETLSISSGTLVESNTQIRNVAVNNSVEFAAENILPNSVFSYDPSASRTSGANIPGWSQFGATHFDTGKATEGNYIRLERQAASGTIGMTSRKIPLKKGRYVFSCGWRKAGYGSGGVVSIDFLRAGVSFGVAGTYADIAFPQTYSASELAVYVEILQDIDDFQFRIQCAASTNSRYFYVFQPQLIVGQRSVVGVPNNRGVIVMWGAAAPTSGTWERGDIVYNTAPAAGGVIGWVCVLGGNPGTWKTFGAISA